MTYRFKRGDQVYHDDEEAIVSDFVGIIKGEPLYRIIYSDPSIPPDNVEERYLRYALFDLPGASLDMDWHHDRKCECGAKFTSFPDSHTSWCPLSKGT